MHAGMSKIEALEEQVHGRSRFVSIHHQAKLISAQ